MSTNTAFHGTTINVAHVAYIAHTGGETWVASMSNGTTIPLNREEMLQIRACIHALAEAALAPSLTTTGTLVHVAPPAAKSTTTKHVVRDASGNIERIVEEPSA